MGEITDFNDINHRVESAAAMFQRGLYHLFTLSEDSDPDVFGRAVRMYQCVFLLCAAQLLLDSRFDLDREKIEGRLLRRCVDPKKPTRGEIDPGAIIKHSIFEGGRWRGFGTGHPLCEVSKKSLELYRRVVEARHNLLYRPFLLANVFWEDCTLGQLIEHLPDVKEVEEAYRKFVGAVVDWHEKGAGPARYFLEMLFMVVRDIKGQRPTETLLLTYGRMLSPLGGRLLEQIRKYRNKVVRVEELKRLRGLTFLEDWKVGEL